MTSSSAAYPVIKGTLVSTENYTWNTADSIGRGASAMVYLGRHKNKGSYVAVKVFHEHLNLKTDDRELQVLRQLKHDNIIQLLDIEPIASGGGNTKRSVLIMEYCEGGSLHHMLDQPTYYYGLSEEEFLLVVYHVCDGMRYLQNQQIIHRDIKPGNIMRSLNGDGFSVYKLTDFGAARRLNEDESFQSLYGTEEYLHPGMYERAVLKLPNSQSFDAKVDLWSLGVTFYHTATGQLPFQPYGGRSNKHTMFEIITQKETGVISGVQNFENGPIQWKRDLPETSPLSSGLKSIVIPILSGLMEPDASKMLTYFSLFRIVRNLREKIVIHVFHFNKCEDLTIYAEPNTSLTGLRDDIAALTDIVASDQILIVTGGKSLEEVVDPAISVKDYPTHLMTGSIYLFQREMTENTRIHKPETPPPFAPDPHSFIDMDDDARLAQSCSAKGELIKRHVEKVCQYEERLIQGMFSLRVFVESRLASTKVSHESLTQLMAECKCHITSFFDMVKFVRDMAAADKCSRKDLDTLNDVLRDTVIRQVHEKASERMNEIEQYRDTLVKKLEDIKNYASKFTACCVDEKCLRKVHHHQTVISGVYSRFRRDKSVKQQMTSHDENIHMFERMKLNSHCITIRSIYIDHCLPQLDKIYKNCSHICESLTKCLTRVAKIEKNILSVQNCQVLLSDKLLKVRMSCTSELQLFRDSGFHTLPSMPEMTDNLAVTKAEAAEAGATAGEKKSLSSAENMMEGTEVKVDESERLLVQNAESLKIKLLSLMDILSVNSQMLIGSLDDSSLQSSGSLSQRAPILPETERDAT